MRNPAAVLDRSRSALVCRRLAARAAPRHRVLARAQRGLALRHVHAARDRCRSTEGRKLTPRIKALMQQGIARGDRAAVAARPARGRHRSDAAEQPRGVRQAQADEGVAAEIHSLDDIIDEMDREPQGDPGPRVQLQPADPRQRRREHLAASSARSRSRSTATTSSKLQELAEQIEDRDRQGRRRRRPRHRQARREQPSIAVKPDRDALARWDLDLGDAAGLLETALSGHTASRAVGRREALRRHRAPAASPRARTSRRSATCACRSRTARSSRSRALADVDDRRPAAPRSRARTASATSASA